MLITGFGVSDEYIVDDVSVDLELEIGWELVDGIDTVVVEAVDSLLVRVELEPSDDVDPVEESVEDS